MTKYNSTFSIEVAMPPEILVFATFSGMRRLLDSGTWRYSECGGYLSYDSAPEWTSDTVS